VSKPHTSRGYCGTCYTHEVLDPEALRRYREAASQKQREKVRARIAEAKQRVLDSGLPLGRLPGRQSLSAVGRSCLTPASTVAEATGRTLDWAL
jgi:hypothetical protein